MWGGGGNPASRLGVGVEQKKRAPQKGSGNVLSRKSYAGVEFPSHAKWGKEER